jgi:hypothetical protein
MARVINVKKDFPTIDYALYLIDQEIKFSKATGNRAIVVIHGYGSSGKGGVIKEAIKNYLPDLKRKRVIIDYVHGENWGETNPIRQKICEACPDLILQENLQSLNSGVTVIFV